jgi:hypothetical protein
MSNSPTFQAAASTVDPAKLLAIFRRWRPAVPVADVITWVNLFIGAAASGCIGPVRVGLLEGLWALAGAVLDLAIQRGKESYFS